MSPVPCMPTSGSAKEVEHEYTYDCKVYLGGFTLCIDFNVLYYCVSRARIRKFMREMRIKEILRAAVPKYQMIVLDTSW